MKGNDVIVTIDGPAGAGKGTVARELARRLGITFLDTGAMYRMVTLAGIRAGIDPADADRLAELLGGLHVDLEGETAKLDGKDVSADIRTPELTVRIQGFADQPLVREFVTRRTRELASERDVVSEGRDQGTVVFPRAECKFFLTASDEVRARRRHEELRAKGVAITYQEVLDAQQERDARDSARAVGALGQAEGAVLVDSSDLDAEQVVDRMEAIVRQQKAAATSPEALRDQMHAWVRKHLDLGNPSGWFEDLYQNAGGDLANIPWADRRPNVHLVAWLKSDPRRPKGCRVLVVGCGLGDDAELLSADNDVVAFDVSPTAIDWARRRFPESRVDYRVADLFDPPADFVASFDFIFEAYTWQALPIEVRPRAIEQVTSFVAPGGRLLVVARGRDESQEAIGPPWPLTFSDLDRVAATLTRESLEDFLDEEAPPVRRFRALFHRPT